MHDSLVHHFNLPETTRLTDIRTIAGGYIAFRFVCEAGLSGFTRAQLPPGSVVPGQVRYVSQLTNDRRQHQVTVRIEPLMILEQVE